MQKIKYPRINKIRNLFRKTGEDKGAIGFDDCIRLDKLIKQNKIKKVLELGTGVGVSTASIAYSLPEDGQIDTLEQFEKCINIAKIVIPAELRKKITFHHSDSEVFSPLKYIYLQKYKFLPEGDWDLVVIDGPGPYREGDYVVALAGGDFIELIKKTKPGTLFFIDGRKSMVKLIDRFYSKYLERLKNKEYSLWRRTAVVAGGELELTDRFLEELSIPK